MVLILVDQITPRIQYTFEFIFSIRGIDFELSTSVTEFEKSSIAHKFNYSGHSAETKCAVLPCLLLRTSELIDLNIQKGKQLDQECLSIEGQVDIVASVFYVLTRYEEYVVRDKDEYGRFKFSSSVLSAFNWVEKVVCDRWAKALIEYIDPDLYIEYTMRNALVSDAKRLVPTFDIDNTFAYQYKKGARKFLSVTKDLLYLRFDRLKERKAVNSGGKDPYDTFDTIKSVARDFEATKLFWLVESGGEKDRNLDINDPDHVRLIKGLNETISINLHPSFDSFGKTAQITREKKILESIIGCEIEATRQHFLRLSLPDTYYNLQKAGVKDEYSMGFAERAGFRCGTARQHQWFDLAKNKKTSLTIHPFSYMDGSLNEYMKLKPKEACEVIDRLYGEVKEYGGEFVFIWHNETIGNYGIWNGWKTVFNHTLKLGRNG